MLYLYRRKVSRGQGSIDYIFMIAMGLLFILIAFAFIIEDSGTSREAAMEHAKNSSIKSQAVIFKSQLEISNFWDDEYMVLLGSNYTIKIYEEEVLIYAVNYENTSFKEDVTKWDNFNGLSLFEIYEACLNNNLTACKFIITLKEGSWEEK